MIPPIVSVVIPAHDSEKYLSAAIESVLAQTYASLEVIVVDDGSNDGTGEIARSYSPRVRTIRQTQSGPAAARNRGVRESHGAFIAFLDADDLWVPHKLAWQMQTLDADPAIDAVFGHVVQFGPGLPPSPDSLPGYTHCAMLIRRDRLLDVGAFDTRFKVGEFIDWYARAQVVGLTSVMIPEVVLRRRVHGENHGCTHRADAGDYARIVKAALDRRRRGTAGTSDA
jgi:glycosyltransferase involved in cell wall biosynthesis